jgi:hypothetical protein
MARADRSKLLHTLLGKLRSAHPDAIPARSGPAEASRSGPSSDRAQGEAAPGAGQHADAPAEGVAGADAVLRELLRSMLIWESTTSRAEAALRRFDRSVVDVNELRACIPAEIAQFIGPNYARAEDRAARLRQTLNDLFTREYAVTMAHLPAMSKRDARSYLDALASAPEYVRDRVFLVALGGHALPVDERILSLLLSAKVVDPGTTPEAASAFLERTLRAGEAAEAYALLQAGADELSASSVAQRPAGSKVASRAEAKPSRTRTPAASAPKRAASAGKPSSKTPGKPAPSARKRGQ